MIEAFQFVFFYLHADGDEKGSRILRKQDATTTKL